MYPENLRYFQEHTWLRVEGKIGIVGITYYAQQALANVVYIDLPRIGTEVKAGMVFGSIESVKVVSDLYAPVSGKIVEVNEKLFDTPELVNADPYDAGWMIKIEIFNFEEVSSLLSCVEYQNIVESGGSNR
ncbi:MAG: glycine cleavage system protein GcvH [Peptococcaceae bacterium]|nr:glycine cleavage system protein GcvH [Peptococcaceae bacterium]MDH7525490.1 glycine cleavage system protein GcvH [Peptococcaceae bacterium]